ncbi:ABC transporter permease [Bifidobacterium platyrrhinorum]|uniref:ABC transporter permease n=1 Tax=Bifidobacterium platyrrhinorum TaxID=2661628 RepID=A0A6L9SV77_9BIFI|nr:ABC transporter permease [Bifidobacterium platyrrhinorum]NEG55763.1 ABC transporter permease [Bifidobacterium platyrrhinorum]
MWTTFVMTLKTNLRNRQSLFWLIVFPIALATLFNGLLGNLAEGYELKALPVAVVEDANWKASPGAKAFIDGLSGKGDDNGAVGGGAVGGEDGAADTTGEGSGAAGENGSAGVNVTVTKLLDAKTVATLDEARARLADGTAKGYLHVDADGRIRLTLSSRAAEAMNGPTATDSNGAVTVAALSGVIDLYNRTDAATRDLLRRHPEALQARAFWSSIGDIADTTRETTLTNSTPNVMARYFYALLGMACLMAMGYSITAVTSAQANLSALGIRRTVAPLGRGRQLAAGFLASWLCSDVSLTIALAYIRYVCDVPLGGREPAAVAAVAVASFMACAFGTMIGAIPGLRHSVKIGLTSAIPCTLSLFSGLYGGFAMQLSDWITRHAPVFALINPAQQVTNLFYDILYYDDYRPFATTCGVLIAMSIVFLAAGVAMLKEQRYEHL